jgi:hypothetical protein
VIADQATLAVPEQEPVDDLIPFIPLCDRFIKSALYTKLCQDVDGAHMKSCQTETAIEVGDVMLEEIKPWTLSRRISSVVEMIIPKAYFFH